MGGRFTGQVALITGAARGQGRSHALRLAQEGADIIAIDICAQIDSVPYAMATPQDLADTAREVEALDRRVVAHQADVRDQSAVRQAVDDGVAQLGRLDIVAANAGISSFAAATDMPEDMWHDIIDTNLTGVWHTAKAAMPHLISGERGGAIVITSSAAGLKAIQHAAHYVSAKHGLVGLTRALALELAPHSIRVNSLHPTAVATEMIMNDVLYSLLRPDLEKPTLEDVSEVMASMNVLPTRWVEPVDVTNALVFLASEDARFITGVTLPIDAGFTIR